MIKRFRQYLSSQDAPKTGGIPAGGRVYAVGDIHGRLDLFEELIERIERDDNARGPAETTIVLLGDLIDRGPDSAGVLDLALALCARRNTRVLCGNHEEMLLRSLSSVDVLRHFLRFGGKETVLSYPLSRQRYNTLSMEELQDEMRRLIPPEHVNFILGMEDYVVIGDYAFVHAGIRPGVPLEQQKRADLRWIREQFLDDPRDHGLIVVHGHTITDEVDECANRIGIDTGAYASGRLTAIGLEGNDRWYLAADEANGVAETASMGRSAA